SDGTVKDDCTYYRCLRDCYYKMEHNIPTTLTLQDIENGHFEPQQRARSNTWPLRGPEEFLDIKEEQNDLDNARPLEPIGELEPLHNLAGMGQVEPHLVPSAPKKNSSRRNAWGNLSYADLITQAIQSSPENRLTLSQIYDWMVANVLYFKDKGDTNSSAGWKNSIRHNLSLHNRFMRVQNEGTGKSSWWMINPDAKPGKSARRRATTMESSQFEKKRGRARKKIDNISGMQSPTSPNSSLSAEGLDMFPQSPVHHGHFHIPGDPRSRAGSNASSLGRLSPIPAAEEPVDWCPQYAIYQREGLERFATDQLVDSLAENMKLRDSSYVNSEVIHTNHNLSMSGSHVTVGINGYQGFHQPLNYTSSFGIRNNVRPSSGMSRSPQTIGSGDVHSPYSLSNIQAMSPNSQSMSHSVSPSHQMETSTHQQSGMMSPPYSQPPPLIRATGYCTIASGAASSSQEILGCSATGPSSLESGNLLRQALGQGLTPPKRSPSNSSTPTPSQMMGQLMGALNSTGQNTMPNDLDISFDNFQPVFQGGIDCNIDEIVKHELNVEGSLDFNFAQGQQSHSQLQPNGGATLTAIASRPWIYRKH
ncbi:hypothetical protein QYM36_009834, partial [Artemia franciscana]